MKITICKYEIGGILYFTVNIIFIIIFLSYANASGQAADTVSSKKDLTPGEVEIIGQRTPSVYSHLARKITVFTREDIETLPATSVQDLLRFTGSIDIRQRNIHGVQADIQFRGGTFDEVMILLNGINITDPQTGHFNLDLPVGLSSVERIEILHGSGTRIYGANAYKGVINIITRTNTNKVTTGISSGDHGLFHSYATAGLTGKRFFNEVSLSKNTSSGFTKNTDYKIYHLYYQGGTSDSQFNLTWQGGLSKKAFGANSFYSPSFPDQFEETATGFGSLGFEMKATLRLTGNVYWRRHFDHFLLERDDPAFYENHHLTDKHGLRLNADFRSILGKTSFGGEARNEQIKSTLLGEDLITPVKINRTDSMYYTKAYSRNSFESFIEQNYVINNLSVTGGFLLIFSKNYRNRIEIFPGIDISYSFPDEKIKLLASLNRSLRLPTFTDMFYKDPSSEGNRELDPEKLITFESGFEYQFKEITAGVTLFRDKGNHVIDWVWQPDRSIYKAMNITEITTQGIEITGEYQPHKSGGKLLSLENAGSSWTFINLGKASGNFESRYSLDYLRHKLQFWFTGSVSENFRSTWQVSYSSRNGSYLDFDLPSQTLSLTSFKPYWLFDTKISYTLKTLKFQIEISNLLNASYTDIGNLVSPGRWIVAGIHFNIGYGK